MGHMRLTNSPSQKLIQRISLSMCVYMYIRASPCSSDFLLSTYNKSGRNPDDPGRVEKLNSGRSLRGIFDSRSLSLSPALQLLSPFFFPSPFPLALHSAFFFLICHTPPFPHSFSLSSAVSIHIPFHSHFHRRRALLYSWACRRQKRLFALMMRPSISPPLIIVREGR